MNAMKNIVDIFHSPARVFDAVRDNPKSPFLLALILVLVCAAGTSNLLIERVGHENIIRQAIESSSRSAELTREQKEAAIAMQTGTVGRLAAGILAPVAVAISFFLGGLIYLLGGNAMGGRLTFRQAMSVWTYSSVPPTVILSLATIVVLLVKTPDDIDIAAFQRGVAVGFNPAMFVDGSVSAPTTAFLSSLDFFQFWGWVLAAIGLSRAAQLSTGSAWGIVILIALAGIALKVVGALF